jgi:hypothetical protein
MKTSPENLPDRESILIKGTSPTAPLDKAIEATASSFLDLRGKLI